MTRAFSWARGRRSALAIALPALIIGAALAGEAAASPTVLPTGGKVVAGKATVGATTGFSLTIDQTSSKAVIDWTTFSIGQGEKVTFDNGAGVTLNRVMGGQVSDINGSLFATGGVYILNPNGVVIGKQGVVNVGGDFIASSLALSDQAFLAGGDLSFASAAGGAVTNLGYIVSANGSLALIGPNVANSGRMEAAKGDVGLAAGEAVVLHARDADDGRLSVLVGGAGTSAENSGLIESAEAELKANGGDIYALAVNPGSGIEATGVSSKDGNVWLIASGGDVTAAGSISAHRADGAGGLVETSGESVGFDGLKVDAGEWLVDPVNLTVNAAAANTISANLATTNVVLQTTAASASGPGVQSPGAGDIVVAAPIDWSSGKSLTLDAYHSIAFDADVTVAGGGQVILKTDDGGTGGGYAFASGASLGYAAGTGAGIAGQALTINGQGFTLIYTEAQLAGINADLTGDFALAGPLSLQGFVFTDAPIAHDAASPFTGAFEGLGNSISDLVIDQTIPDPQTLSGLTWQGSVGLFGVIGAAGVVRDLSVTNADVMGGDNMRVGALAGVVLGTALNDTSSGEVSVGDTLDPTALDAAEAGGLVGSLRQGGQILDSQSSASVSGGSAIVGGLVGAETDPASLISGSSASGVVTAGASTSLQTAIGGGLVGEAAGQASDDYATAQVKGGAGAWIGGFAGYVDGGSISDSYASGAVIGVSGPSPSLVTLAGGFAGNIDGGASVSDAYELGSVTTTGGAQATVGGFAGVVQGDSSVSSFYATGQVSVAAGAEVGGLVGQVGNAADGSGTGGTISDGYWDEGTTGQSSGYSLAGAGSATSVGAVGGASNASAYGKASYAGFDFNSVWYLIPGETRPILRSEYSTTVVNAHQLQLMALDPTASYTLDADIDASETASASGVWNPANGFVPVGGNGAAAFTGVFEGADHTISNLFIDDATPVAQTFLSGFATEGVVGLFGWIGAAGVVRDVSLVAANVTGKGAMYVGALSGFDQGSISNATTSGQVTSGDSTGSELALAGGLSGAVAGTVADSSSAAAVTGGNGAGAGGLVGGLAGGGSISGSAASGNVAVGAAIASASNLPFAGGLLGEAFGYDAENHTDPDPVSVASSYATGAVTGGGGSWVGGFVAGVQNGLVTTSYATGAATQTEATAAVNNLIGGFVGYVGANGSVSQSWSSGAVSTVGGPAASSDTFAGGFVGEVGVGGSVTDAYSLSPVAATGGSLSLEGGFVGVASGAVSQFYATGLVSGPGTVGGLVGELNGTASDGYWDEGTTGQTAAVGAGGTGTDLVGVGGSTGLSPYAASTYANFDLTNTWYIIDGETRPILRSEYSTTITDAHQLELMGLDPGADYTLAGDIDAGETSSAYGVWNPANGFVPVGSVSAPFTGTLNGQGFTISGLNIVVAQGAAQSFEGLTTDGFAGLFGVVDGPSALIQNVNLAGVSVSGGDGVEVGALAGAFLQGAIENAASSGEVSGGDALVDASGNRINAAVGGLVGLMGSQSASGPAAAITGSSSSAAVGGGDAFVGGLVGSTLTGSSIAGSWASGAVAVGATSGTAGEIAVGGGLVGSVYGATLADDYATGAVSGAGGSAVGGFAGYVGSSQVSASYATGAVSQSATSFSFSNYAGGFAGYVDTGSTVSTSFASGAVNTIGASSAPSTFAGGFAGYVNGSVSQAYATGAVASTGPADNVGGFAGEIDAGGSVNQVYATGSVTGAGSVGGLAGQLAGALSNSYWDEGTTGQTVGYVNAGGVATTVVGVGGATGVSPFEAATYAGWDFSQTWSQPSTGEYPELLGVSHVLEIVAGTETAVYGQYPVYTYQVLGVQDADIQYSNPILETPSGVTSSTSGWIDVGTYALNPSSVTASGRSGAYRSIYVAGALTVTPAPVDVTLTGAVDKIYDGTTAATILGSNLSLSGLVAGDAVSGTAGSAAYATKNAGTGIEVTASGVALTGADAANYTLVGSTASGAVGEIDPKTLTVTLAGTVDKIYDGTTAAALAGSDYQLGGVIGGDSVSLNEPTAGTYATKNAGSGIAVTVGGLALTGADAHDYTVATTATGDIGEIDPKVLTVTLAGLVEKTYDGTTSATLSASNYQLSGVIGGDSVSLNDPTAGAYATKNAGSGINVTAGGLALTGADAGDYTVANSASADIGKIDPKALTASLVGTVSKVYDGTTIATLTASNYQLSGVIGGDTVSLNDPTTGAYATSQVGTGIKVTTTGLVLSGADASDYTVNGAASAPIGIITSAAPVVTPGQVDIQVIATAQVDTIDQPLTPPSPDDESLGGQGANPTAYTVFPLSQGAGAAAAGEASPVTGAGNGDLWAGSDLDPAQSCPPDQQDCRKAAPNR